MSKVLMVDPNNYELAYCINPWMNTDVVVDTELARSQWDTVHNRLVKDGIEVEVMPSSEGLPDMVFAANAGMVHNGTAIVSNFRDKERQKEEFPFEQWFRTNGFETFTLPDSNVWEGEACSVFIGSELLCSFSLGGRAHLDSYKYIGEIWEIPNEKMKFVELIDPYFYHLDVCFCLLDNETALLCPLAFKSFDYAWIKERIPRIIEVSYDDALNFNCNAFVHGKNVYFNHGISESLKQSLDRAGYRAVEINVSEFIKAGGAVKCLILTLEK